MIYWAGLLLIVLPIFYRLDLEGRLGARTVGLVCLLGLALYGVKVVQDSLLFTFPDEFVHAYNAGQIVDHHHLFRAIPYSRSPPDTPGWRGRLRR